MNSWNSILSTLLTGADLNAVAAAWAMREIVRGDATPARLAAFLVALRAKGESAGEVEAMADACLDAAVPLEIPGHIVDIVGTGGDRSGIGNVSTMAAIVVASLGHTVVKHGGRGASSPTGAADTVEELGVPLDLPAAAVADVARMTGLTFCFAPAFHPGLRHAAPVRRELGVPTVFNLLAPLVNPARPRRGLVGVWDRRYGPVLADVLARRGASAIVVNGDDGVDKLSTRAPSTAWLVRDGTVTVLRIDPAALGIPAPEPSLLRRPGAAAVRSVLCGEPGALREAVVLNAAAALLAIEPGSQLPSNLARCAAAIDSGAALDRLERWIAAAHLHRPDSPARIALPCGRMHAAAAALRNGVHSGRKPEPIPDLSAHGSK